MLSAFGEHLIGEEIEARRRRRRAAIGADVTDFSVGALYPERDGRLGGHLYVVEFDRRRRTMPRVARFAARSTHALRRLNDDYRAHRADGHGLHAPRVQAVPPGTFAAWMKSRGRAGGQNKVPRIINDRNLFDNLRAFVGAGNRRGP